MSVFQRYLTLWVALCIVAGVALGNFLPGLFRLIAAAEAFQVNLPVAGLVWLMIVPMLVKIDFAALHRVRDYWRGIGVTLIVNWAVKPFSMALLGWLFIAGLFAPYLPAAELDGYVAGLILLAAAPCTAMVFIWSNLCDGEPHFTLSQVALNDIIMVFAFAPIVALLLGLSAISVPWQTLLLSVGLYIVVPVLLAQALRRSVLARGEAALARLQGHLQPLSLLALLTTLVLLFGLRFLHSLREPLAAMASWFRLAWDKEGPAPDLPGLALIRSIYHAKPIFSGAINLKSTTAPKLGPDDHERLAQWDGANCRGVRLEDLHATPRQTIERVCAWLGLPWHEALLESTFDGRPWGQASIDGSVVVGFRGPIAAPPDDLYGPLDRLRIKLLLADKYRVWNYRSPAWFDNRLLPGLAFMLWPLPFRMERRVWRAGRPRTPAKVLAAWRGYLALRRDVVGWWWRDRRNGVPVIRSL